MVKDQSRVLFPNENPETLPFMFQFGEEVDGSENRQSGMESEYWTPKILTGDTD